MAFDLFSCYGWEFKYDNWYGRVVFKPKMILSQDEYRDAIKQLQYMIFDTEHGFESSVELVISGTMRWCLNGGKKHKELELFYNKRDGGTIAVKFMEPDDLVIFKLRYL